jgi:CheY-like chemotaxis protein
MPHPLALPLALVVDDDPEIRAMLVEMLEQVGLRGMPIADPHAVVAVAVAEQPALILLDVMMPEMDGYTVAVRLRGNPVTARIPIVFITGRTAPVYQTLGFSLDAVAFVEKPFNLTTLRAAVGQALSV